MVKPKLLLSFGVSGAVNHVTGFSDADVVVAVNTDPEAAIFNYCTYGIVGDMDEVCEAMARKARRVSWNEHAKKHPKGCFFAYCPCVRRYCSGAFDRRHTAAYNVDTT